jgi:hypothetical protein
MAARHHIHRQRLVIEIADAQPGTTWHDRLERLHQRHLLPVMEGVFDDLDRGGRHPIDRLEVIIRVDDSDRLDHQVAEGLERVLRRALTEAFSTSPTQTDASIIETLLCFLRTGNLHWSVAKPEEWLREIADGIDGWTEADWQLLLHHIEQRSKAVVRLAALPLPVRKSILARGGTSDVQKSLRAPDRPRSQEIREVRQGIRKKTADSSTSDVQPVSKLAPANTKDHRPPSPTPFQPANEAPTWHPTNSGLVLLHPYLSYLFGQVDVRPDPKKPATLARAASLLHYLAFGTDDCREWDLPLAKVLLGLHPDDLLTPAPALKVNDQEQADELLRGVIGHWAVLGSTSIDGLREGFLRRPGRLEHAPAGWRLTVELQAHDLLLERLPWSLTPVRTPWMDELLHVDWG